MDDVQLQDEDAEAMAADAESSAAPVRGGNNRDAGGRRVKGRGTAGSSAMADGTKFDSIPNKGGSGRGPAECAPPPPTRAHLSRPCTSSP